MIQTDFLLIGQGIAGTLLSHELMRLGKKVFVIDKFKPHKASLVAGAVLNPMAGKHWAPAAQASVFLPKAIETYRRFENLLDISIITDTQLNVFHENEAKRILFEQQQQAFPEYFETLTGTNEPFFNNEFGNGIIKGLYRVNAATLLTKWRLYLESKNAFKEAAFNFDEIKILPNEVKYQNITASKIIFCIGADAVSAPFFKDLPFTKNRGEALIVSIPGLPADTIYHKQLRLIPKGNDLFWCGSNYLWNFEDLEPNEAWRNNAIKNLQEWLKLSFEVKDHIVAQRPTTAGQVPILKMHPEFRTIAIFNGLGTRGFSSGPYWAAELAKLLLHSGV